MSDRRLPVLRPRHPENATPSALEETVIASLLVTYRELAETSLDDEKLRRFLQHKVAVQKNRLALRVSLHIHR